MQTNILSQQQDVQTENNVDWEGFWTSFNEILSKIPASDISSRSTLFAFNQEKYRNRINSELEQARYAALNQILVFKHSQTAAVAEENSLLDRKSPHISVIKEDLFCALPLFSGGNLAIARNYFAVLRKKEVWHFDDYERQLLFDFDAMFFAYASRVSLDAVWRYRRFYSRIKALQKNLSEDSYHLLETHEQNLVQQIKRKLLELFTDHTSRLRSVDYNVDIISSDSILERTRKANFLGRYSKAYKKTEVVLTIMNRILLDKSTLVDALNQLAKCLPRDKRAPFDEIEMLVSNSGAIHEVVNLMTAREMAVEEEKRAIAALAIPYCVESFQFPDSLVLIPAHVEYLAAEIFTQLSLDQDQDETHCFVSFDTNKAQLHVNISEPLKGVLVSVFDPAHPATYFFLLLLTLELIRVKDKVLPHKTIIKQLIAALLKGKDCAELIKSPFFMINTPEFLSPYLTAKIELPFNVVRTNILAEIDKYIPPASFSEMLEQFSDKKLNDYAEKCFLEIPETHRHDRHISALLKINVANYPIINKSLLCAYSVWQCYKPFKEPVHEVSVMNTCRKNTTDYHANVLAKFEAVLQGEVSIVSLLDFLSVPLDYQDEPLSELLTIMQEILLDQYELTTVADDNDLSSEEALDANPLTSVKTALFGEEYSEKAPVIRPARKVRFGLDN